MKVIKIERDNDQDTQFTGEIIASASSSPGKNMFAMEVTGDSMNASQGFVFAPGDLAHIDPDITCPMEDEYVLVVVEGDNEPILRQYKTEGGKPYLSALNPAWPPIFKPSRVIGVVATKSANSLLNRNRGEV